MNYIYDILLNFTDTDRLIEFYEWNEYDCFEHIKRMPLYRISSKQMEEVCTNKIIIDKSFLNEIKGQTISYKNKKDIKYGLLITDSNKAIALEFNSKGMIISKSSLLLDEEEDIISESYNINSITLPYTIVEPYQLDYFLTRDEDFKKHYLLKELEYIDKNKDYDKLNYLYEELFGKDNLKYEERLHTLINSIKNNYNNKHNELYEIVRLTYIKK